MLLDQKLKKTILKLSLFVLIGIAFLIDGPEYWNGGFERLEGNVLGFFNIPSHRQPDKDVLLESPPVRSIRLVVGQVFQHSNIPE